MKMRISRLRRDFGMEPITYIERDAQGEQPYGNKPGNNMPISIKKKVLEIGLQAANEIIVRALISYRYLEIPISNLLVV